MDRLYNYACGDDHWFESPAKEEAVPCHECPKWALRTSQSKESYEARRRHQQAVARRKRAAAA
jgi:hypothetical protein